MRDPVESKRTSVELLARAKAGDSEAFGQLFEAAAPRVLMYVQLRLSRGLARRLEPQDVLQDTALYALDSIASFEPRGAGAFSRWLCAIAENRMRDAAEHHNALKRRPPGEREALTLVLERIRDHVTGPATAVQRDEQRELLQARLCALDEDERQALLLRFFRGASTTDIAAELGLSPSSARRLLARASAKLGRELGEESR